MWTLIPLPPRAAASSVLRPVGGRRVRRAGGGSHRQRDDVHGRGRQCQPTDQAGGGLLTSPSPSVAFRPLPAEAPDSFDPWIQYARVGWVPDGSLGTSVTVTRDWLTVTTDYQGLPTGKSTEPSPGRVTLLVGTAGHGIDPLRLNSNSYVVDADQMRPGQPEDPVNGGAAQSIDGYGTTRRWQYAPGAWAAVSVYNLAAGRCPQLAGHESVAGRPSGPFTVWQIFPSMTDWK